jgi:hypothetical protein
MGRSDVWFGLDREEVCAQRIRGGNQLINVALGPLNL